MLRKPTKTVEAATGVLDWEEMPEVSGPSNGKVFLRVQTPVVVDSKPSMSYSNGNVPFSRKALVHP